MKKKLLGWLLTLVSALCVFAFAACSSDPTPKEPEITIELQDTLTVGLFKTATLTATTNSEEAVVYTSSDESVLTIADNGLITPLKAGTATVRASVEEKFAECAVTVTAPEESEVSIAAVTRTLNLKTTKTATIEAQAYVGEEMIEGTSFTYQSSDETIVTVDNSGVATGVNKGTATITVSGTCKGFSFGSDTVSVTVTEDVTIETSYTQLELYTSAASSETPNESALSVVVKNNGDEVENPDFQVTSSDDKIVAYENGKLVAKGTKGSATVTVSYTSALGTEASAEIAVTTIHPTEKKTIATTYSIGLNRGTAIEIEPDFDVVSVLNATIGEEEYPAKFTSGKIVVEMNGVAAADTEYTIIVSADSDDTTYQLTVKAMVYDYLIGEKSEFTAFLKSLNGTEYIYAKLTANVDMENTAVQTANNNADCTGDGIVTAFSLDGAGYTVSNMSAQGVRGAIASRVGRKSVIKNIALNNVEAAGASAGGLFTTVSSISFSNVYVSISVNYCWGGTIALWSLSDVSYDNVVVYCTSVADANRTTNGFKDIGATGKSTILGALTSEGICNAEKNYTNTFAINPVATKMIRGTGTRTNEASSQAVKDDKGYAVEDDWNDENQLAYTEGLYTSWEAFSKAVGSLPSAFDSAIWKINDDGELVFISMPEKVKPVFTKRPLIEGKDNANIFAAVDATQNTIAWVEEESVYLLTNNVTAEDNSRGFYIDFDFIDTLRERGATSLSFDFKNDHTTYQTYISYTTDKAGSGWWNNRPAGWNHNTASDGWHSFTMDFSSIEKGLTIFILSTGTGGFRIRNFKVDYSAATTVITTIDCSASTITVGGTGISGSGNKTYAFITESLPEGASGACIKTDSNIYHGLTLTLNTPVTATENILYITVRIYVSQDTQLRFYTPGWTESASEYSADAFVTVTGGQWYDVVLVVDGYIKDGKIQDVIFIDFTGSEIYIDSISLLGLKEDDK